MNFVIQLLKSILGMGAKTVAGGQTGTEVMHQPPDILMATQANYLYHRNTYRNLLWLSLIEGGIIAILIIAAAFIILTANPQDRFFVASVDGRITRIIPLDTPLMNNSEMYVRVGTSVASAMTFGFLDYEQRKIEVGSSFEPEAFATLQNAVLGTGGINGMIQNNHIYVSAVEPARPGGVVNQGVSENTYQWVISVPVAVIVKNGLDESSQMMTRWNVQVLVQRAKALEVRHGFIITNVLSATPEGPAQPVAPAAAPPNGGQP